MGLLDGIQSDEGLLGLMLMQAAQPRAGGRTGFGEGLLGAVQAMQQRKAQQEDRDMRKQQFGLQQQQLQMALEQAKRQTAREKTLEDLPAQFMKPGQMPPSMDARDIGQPGEQQIPAQQFDMAGYANAMFRYDPRTALALQQSLQKDNTPFLLPEGQAAYARGPNGMPDFSRPIATNPKDAKPSDLARLLQEMSALPPNDPRRAVYQQQITKMTTHAPGTSVNIDRAPPGYLWQGPGKLAPIPGGPADKLPERQQNQVVGVQNLRDAIGEYRAQLGTHSKMDVLSPGARAEMGTKYQNMMLQAKEAYNLGVLNGPDMQVLQSVITDPMSINGLMTPRRSLDRQAAELDRIMAKIAGVSSQVRPRGASASPSEPGQVINFSDLKD